MTLREHGRASLARDCEIVEEAYEFMLAYAAQGVASGGRSDSEQQLREFLNRAVDSLSGLADRLATLVRVEGLTPAASYHTFLAVLDRDARDALAAIGLVVAQPSISSQLIDNLNASIHLRALLTDLFLIDEVLKRAPASPTDTGGVG